MKRSMMFLLAMMMTVGALGCDNRSDLERNVDEAASDAKRAVNDATD